MGSEEPVYVVVLTPPGRGAIATLRIEGPGAIDRVRPWIRSVSGKPVQNVPEDRPILVRFGPEPAEEVLLRAFSDRCLDLHCHGGSAAVGRIQTLLSQTGCLLVDWKTWLASQPADPIAKEAVLGLTSALTERTASILLDQLHGALRRQIQQLVHALQCRQRSWAEECLAGLLKRADVGKHLTRPWQVVLVGRPNVGKSSLLNALLGYHRAIVHPQPGTTRDVVSATTALDGWPVELVDTAGWRESADPLEQAGMALARQQAQQADLIVVVSDGSQPWTETDTAFCRAFPNGLLVHNKCDLLPTSGTLRPSAAFPQEVNQAIGSLPPGATSAEPPRSVEEAPPIGPEGPMGSVEAPLVGLEEKFPQPADRPAGLSISARTGQGLPELVRAIVHRLISEPPPPGAAVPFHDRQIQALQSAQQALRQDDLEGALRALHALLGSPAE